MYIIYIIIYKVFKLGYYVPNFVSAINVKIQNVNTNHENKFAFKTNYLLNNKILLRNKNIL